MKRMSVYAVVCGAIWAGWLCGGTPRAFAGEVSGLKTEVKNHKGRPTFFLNGQPYTKPLFATYVPTEHYYRQMAEIGCEVFNFQTNCSACDIGFSTPVWKSPDEWDFSQMDQRARMILAVKPDGMILPRIYIGTPQWWQEKYPQEMTVLDHGGTIYQKPCNQFMGVDKRPYPSLASAQWRQDMGQALRKTIEHMQNSDYGPHIFGYEIAALGSEEWYYLTVNQMQLGDYNPQMRAAFQQWLQKKYVTKERLQAAWNRPGLDFCAAAIPGKTERIGDPNQTFRHPAAEMPVIDFYVFYNEFLADTIDYFAGIVKEVTGRQKVVGAFYNYMYEFRGGPEFGHNAGGRIMRSDNIDFICAPPSYYERQNGSGAECYRRPFLPGTLHNKLWFHDNDLASFLFFRIMRKQGIPEATIAHYATQIYPTPTAQESIWLYQRAAGFVLCEGIYQSFFDLHGGYFDHPQILEAVGEMMRAEDQAKDWDRSSAAEILILADEESLAYRTFISDWPPRPQPWNLNQLLMSHQVPFIKAGVPFDSGLLSDLDVINWSQYKMVVFLNAWNMSDADRQKIAEKVKNHNRLLVWCYAPGLFNGPQESPAAMAALTGITVLPGAPDVRIEPKQTLTPAGCQWVQAAGEKMADTPFGLDGPVCQLFFASDKDTEVWAVLAGTQTPTLVRKPMPEWTSVYSLLPVFTPELIRAMARSAGVHVYSTSNDAFYANKSYLTINAATGGEKIISLPRKATIYNALTGYKYYENVEQFELSFMAGETKILRYE